jgi:hypothetical protein
MPLPMTKSNHKYRASIFRLAFDAAGIDEAERRSENAEVGN